MNFYNRFGRKKRLKKYHFPIVVEMDEDGVFIVSCPTFKGCHSYGGTIDEALENLRDVIEMCMEEQVTESVNQFIGVRDMEISI